MAYTITGPEKLILLEKYFRKKPLVGKILDIGGNKESFEWLGGFSKNSEVFTLNNFKGHLRGVANPIEYDAEKQKLPYKNGSVTAVFLLDIIEHLIEPTNIISESQRVLKGGVNRHNHPKFGDFL